MDHRSAIGLGNQQKCRRSSREESTNDPRRYASGVPDDTDRSNPPRFSIRSIPIESYDGVAKQRFSPQTPPPRFFRCVPITRRSRSGSVGFPFERTNIEIQAIAPNLLHLLSSHTCKYMYMCKYLYTYIHTDISYSHVSIHI